MNKNKFKAAILSFAAAAFMMFGLSACDKGTEPGETNVERSDIRDEGELIEREDVQYGEADSLEEHYDHADHEDHEDNTNKAIGDGAYDGKGDGTQRDEVQ